MNKTHYFIIGGVVVVLAIIIGVYAVFASPTVSAQLLYTSGNVQVDQGKGYLAVSADMELGLGDKIKTGSDGDATVVLYESVLVQLEPDTEIAINNLQQRNLKVTQSSGSTWNKFAKITGVENYEVATPDTVATVRGTYFKFANNSVLLANGALTQSAGPNTLSLSGLSKSSYSAGSLSPATVTDSDRNSIVSQTDKLVRELIRLRAIEVRKHTTVLKMIYTRYGMTADQVIQKLAELDNNNDDLDAIARQAPVQLAAINKVKEMTKEIRKIKAQPILPPSPSGSGTPTGATGAGSTSTCPGAENCCCQHGWPDCSAGFECRQWNVPGHQYFGTCVKRGAAANAPLVLGSDQPPYCGK